MAYSPSASPETRPHLDIDQTLAYWDEKIGNDEDFTKRDLFMIGWNLIVVRNAIVGRDWRSMPEVSLYGKGEPVQLSTQPPEEGIVPKIVYITLHPQSKFRLDRRYSENRGKYKHDLQSWAPHPEIEGFSHYRRLPKTQDELNTIGQTVWASYINDRILI